MTCPDCEKLRKRVERLEKENEGLKRQLRELVRRLALYENAHAPPSQRRYPARQDGGQLAGKRFSGRPEGHPGTTRPVPKPDVVARPEWDKCPRCGNKLGKPTRVRRRIVEDIPEPRPVVVKEFLEFEGDCHSCGAHLVVKHPDCPPEGRFGKNLLACVALLKCEGRLPHHKIREMLEWQYGISVSTATIFDITRRVSDWLRPGYGEVLQKIRGSPAICADETGERVDGRKHWLWAFATSTETLVTIRKSRGAKVLKETLGEGFAGFITCDGWKSYAVFTRKVQRDWAHLLREADWLAEHVEEAGPLQRALHRLYGDLKASLEGDPPPEKRARMAKNARLRLEHWLGKRYMSDEIRKFVKKIRNGTRCWFTFVVHSEVESTSNRAERALREHVVQRKIIGTFRNEKGTSIYATIMTMLATWKQRGLDPSQALAESLTKAWQS